MSPAATSTTTCSVGCLPLVAALALALAVCTASAQQQQQQPPASGVPVPDFPDTFTAGFFQEFETFGPHGVKVLQEGRMYFDWPNARARIDLTGEMTALSVYESLVSFKPPTGWVAQIADSQVKCEALTSFQPPAIAPSTYAKYMAFNGTEIKFGIPAFRWKVDMNANNVNTTGYLWTVNRGSTAPDSTLLAAELLQASPAFTYSTTQSFWDVRPTVPSDAAFFTPPSQCH